jgi:hypothetical protein
MTVSSFIDVERELLSIRREIARQRNEDRRIREKLSHAAGSSTAGLFYASDPSGEHGDLSGLTDDDHPHYLLADGTRDGASSQAQDFGSNGVKADVVAESTADTGVTVDGVLIKDGTVDGVDVAAVRTFFNGSFAETFNATVTSNGTIITMSLEQSGTGDLTMQFSDGDTVLDCTPAATIVLTAGTDSSPQVNYIYIPQSTKVLTKSTSDWPSAEHIKVSYFLVPSATFVQSYGCYVNQNWNDHLTGTDSQGHMSHIAQKVRSLGATWYSGISANGATASYFTISASNTEWISTSGVVFQMHPHAFPAVDTSGGDTLLVKNWSGDAYHEISDLFSIIDDSTGSSISNNRYFNLVFWGVANKSGEQEWVIVNLPSGSYVLQSDAANDVSGYDDYTIPREFNIESSTGFMICRATFQMGSTWTHVDTVDLRGSIIATAGGSSINDHGGLGGLTDDDHTQYFLLAGETTDAKLFSGADLYAYSDAGSTVKAQLYGASGNFDLAGDIEFQTDGSFIGLGASSARTVYNAAGSEISLRSAADFALYSSADTATEKLRLDGATGSVYTADNAEVGVNGGGRTVYSTSGSEVSLRSGADFTLYLSADTSNEKLRLDGATGSVYVGDGSDVGISGAIRLTFNSTASPDRVEVTGGDVYFASTNRGIIHVDGNTAGRVLRADGTRYIPDTLDIGDITDVAYVAPGLTFGTSNAEGAGNFVIRADATIAIFDTNNPTHVAAGSSGSPGSVAYAARRDHEHEVTSSSNPGSTVSLLSTASGGGLRLLRFGIGVTPSVNNRLEIVNSGTIGQASGPLLTFDDTDNELQLSGGDLVLDDGSVDSPALKFITGTNNDAATIFLDEELPAGGSDLVIRLPDAAGASKVEIQDSSSVAVLQLDSDGNIELQSSTWIGFASGGPKFTFDNPDNEVQLTTGSLLIGTTTSNSSYMTTGLVIDQGTADNQIVCLRSSTDVDHGMTTWATTDTFGRITKADFPGADGGINIDGWADAGGVGMIMSGIGVTDITTKTTSSGGYVMLRGYKKNGTDIQSVGTSGNLVVIRNAATTRWIVDAEGDIFYGGSDDGSITDDYDDVALLTGFRALRAPDGSPVKSVFERRFKRFVSDAEGVLVQQGVLTAPLSEGGLVSRSGLDGLMIDAMRQLYSRIEYLEHRLVEAGLS